MSEYRKVMKLRATFVKLAYELNFDGGYVGDGIPVIFPYPDCKVALSFFDLIDNNQNLFKPEVIRKTLLNISSMGVDVEIYIDDKNYNKLHDSLKTIILPVENKKEILRKQLKKINHELTLIHHFMEFNDFSNDIYEAADNELAKVEGDIWSIRETLLNVPWQKQAD